MKNSNNLFINAPFAINFISEPIPSESQAYLEIMFAMKGKCNIEINKQAFILNAGDIISISPYELREIFEGDFTLLSLKININNYSFLSEAFETNEIICNSTLINNKTKYIKLRTLLANLLKYNLSDKIYSTTNYALVSAVIAELIESFSTPRTKKLDNESKNKERVRDIINYIYKNYDQIITLNELADNFHLSVPYLSSFFIKNFNMSFTQYYSEVRLNHALKDLLNTNASIEDIALKNGFPSSHAFLRAFKGKFNELPSDYRRNALTLKKKHQNSYENNLSNEDLQILSDFINNENSLIKQPTIVESVDIGSVSTENATEHIINPTTKILGLGTAKILIYSSIQDTIKDCITRCRFEYGHIRGIFNDELFFVSRLIDDSINYNFTLISNILDVIIKNNLKPMIELNYMPEALAKNKEKTVFSNRYIASSPAKMSEWCELIDVFITHCINRYGIDSVKQWIFIPWSQPDSAKEQFAFDSLENFYRFYKATYTTIKKINIGIHVSSPEIMPLFPDRIEWLENFLIYTKENNCIPDSLSLSIYNDTKNGISFFRNSANIRQAPPSFIISDDQSRMKTILETVDNVLVTQGLNYLYKYITSYNLTLSHNNLIYDTIYMSSYIAKNIIDNIANVNGFGYWKISDFEENYGGSGAFPSGIGLYYANGIQKPQMHAYLMLSRMYNYIIKRGDGYIITKDTSYNDKYYVVLYNYEHPSHIFNQNQMFDMNYTNRYSPFKMIEKDFHLILTDIDAEEIMVTETAVNQEHGSAFDKWIRMGTPEHNQEGASTSLVYESLLYSSLPDFTQKRKKIIKGTYEINAHLSPLEIRSIEIKVLKNKKK